MNNCLWHVDGTEIYFKHFKLLDEFELTKNLDMNEMSFKKYLINKEQIKPIKSNIFSKQIWNEDHEKCYIRIMQRGKRWQIGSHVYINFIQKVKMKMIEKGFYDPRYEKTMNKGSDNFFDMRGFNDNVKKHVNTLLSNMYQETIRESILFYEELTAAYLEKLFQIKKLKIFSDFSRYEIAGDYMVKDCFVALERVSEQFRSHFLNVESELPKGEMWQYKKSEENNSMSIHGTLRKHVQIKVYTKSPNILRFEVVYKNAEACHSLLKINSLFKEDFDLIYTRSQQMFSDIFDQMISEIKDKYRQWDQDECLERMFAFFKAWVAFGSEKVASHPELFNLFRILFFKGKIKITNYEEGKNKKNSLSRLVKRLVKLGYLEELKVRKGYYKPCGDFERGFRFLLESFKKYKLNFLYKAS